MKVLNFFTGFFTDKDGKSSRKAATLYICLFFLYVIIREGNFDMDNISILGVLTIIILFCLGAITKEQVSKLTDKAIDKDA